MRYIKEFLRFIKHIYQSRELLLTLIKNDFKKQYLGSYLGFLWAFIQPLTFIMVIWFVFELGFRTGSSTDGVPFFFVPDLRYDTVVFYFKYTYKCCGFSC